MLNDKENLERTLFRLEQGNAALKQLCLQRSTLLDVECMREAFHLYIQSSIIEKTTAAATSDTNMISI